MDKNKTCSIDVDTINDFMERDGVLYKPEVEKIKHNLKLITNEMEKINILIIALCDHHYGDTEHAIAETELQCNGGPFPFHAGDGFGSLKIPETCCQNSKYIFTDQLKLDENDLIDPLGDLYTQYIIEKQSIDAMFRVENPGGNRFFEPLLDMLFVETCFIYGVYTEYCIYENARSILETGREVYIVIDAICAYDNNDAMEKIRDLAQLGAKFITTKELINLLRNNFGC